MKSKKKLKKEYKRRFNYRVEILATHWLLTNTDHLISSYLFIEEASRWDLKEKRKISAVRTKVVKVLADKL